jgi:hypothetical protein
MAADVELTPFDDRGVEILDELEHQTGLRPYQTTEESRSRHYYLSAAEAGVDGFDAMLDLIEPSWQEHLTRTGLL